MVLTRHCDKCNRDYKCNGNVNRDCSINIQCLCIPCTVKTLGIKMCIETFENCYKGIVEEESIVVALGM
jgi:hypothetical protein